VGPALRRRSAATEEVHFCGENAKSIVIENLHEIVQRFIVGGRSSRDLCNGITLLVLG
jgi:hypothetical protein